MNIDQDYDNEGNNIVPCPICLDVYCPSNHGTSRCPLEDEFAKDMTLRQEIQDLMPERKDRPRTPENEQESQWVSELLGYNRALDDVEAVLPQIIALAEKRGAKHLAWNLGAKIEEADLVRKITEDTGSPEAHYAVRDVLGKVHDFINQLTQPTPLTNDKE